MMKALAFALFAALASFGTAHAQIGSPIYNPGLTSGGSILGTRLITCAGTSADGTAIQAALTAGYSVALYAPSGSVCDTTATISPLSGETIASWIGITNLQLNSASISRIVDLTSLNNVTINNVELDGANALAGGDFIRFYNTTNSTLSNCVVNNAPGAASSGAIIFAQTSIKNTLSNCQILSAQGNAAIAINGAGAYGNTISGNILSNSGTFGVRVLGGASNNKIINNYSYTSGVEAYAVSLNSHGNLIEGNYAEYTGDNCISLVGDHNTVIGNTLRYCRAAGVYSWGAYNNVNDNSVLDASQVGAGAWPCVGMNGDYGGTAQGVTVTGNTCDDDQATPTQGGIAQKGPNYSAWATATSYTAGQFVYNGLNVYTAGSTATSGATAPTCTSGTCSDGTITWTYDSTFQTQVATLFNSLTGNTVVRFAGTSNYPGVPIQAGVLNRNPDFFVSQPYVSTSASSVASGSTIIDGWTLGVTNSKVTYQRTITSSLSGYPNYFAITSTSAYTPASTDVYQIISRVEGSDVSYLQWGTANAQPVELDIALNTHLVFGCVGIVLDDGQVSQTYVTSACTTAVDAWQTFSIVIPGDVTGTWNNGPNAVGMRISIGFGAGSTKLSSTVNQWQTAAGGYIGPTGMLQIVSTSGAILRVGYVHLLPLGTPYVRRTYTQELALAERYYFKTFADGTVPAQNAGLAGAFCVNNPIALGEPGGFLKLPNDFSLINASPTVTTYNPSAANANWRDVTAGSDVAVTVDPSTAIGKNGVQLVTGATVPTLNDNLCIHATVDSKH